MRRGMMAAMMAAAAAWLCVSSVHAALPIRPPVELKQQSSAPTERAGEISIAPPMLEVAPTPEMRSAGLYTPDEFPSEVPQRPNVNSEPLPLSPPGTYLHTAVLIKNRMYIYGGLSSYEPEKYMNDLWMFDAGESEFVQLQGNFVPPLPQASQWLKPKEAEAFAPKDVPEMPELETAPRHERSAVEHLNPNANPVSPFLPRARAQKPVRVVALEHMYMKDADKPLASGMGSVEQIYNPAAAAARQQKIAQQNQQTRARQQQQRAELRAKKNNRGAAPLSPAAAGGELRLTEQEWKVRNAILTLQNLQAEHVHVAEPQQPQQPQQQHEPAQQAVPQQQMPQQAPQDQQAQQQQQEQPQEQQPQEPAPTFFLDTEDHLSMHHKERSRFLHRTLAALQSRATAKSTIRRQEATSWPGDNSGTPYSDPRVHRDGIAANEHQHEQPPQDRATQKFHPGTATAESAPHDARETVPHASQDFWCYDFDSHAWEVVNVTSSQPLAHSPWFTPAQLEDPVFKDPLPIVLPPQRRLHTSVVMKDRMIVFGGVSYNNLILGDIWIFSPEEQSWIEASADGPGGSPILPREGHSAITTGDELTMLVFGGVSYGFLPFNDLWSYSAVDNRWQRLSSHEDPSLPLQRWLHTAVFHETSNTMVVFGGITAHYVPLNDVHIYDIGSNTWNKAVTTETPPFPRMMHTAVVFNDWMLISGGAANNLPMDDMFVLDLNSWEWRELIQTSAYPFARTGASAIVLSPARRAKEEGESPDLSADASDPHLRWFADQNVLASRPVVGSFSSEGLAEREEQEGNLAGLDQIAFPLNPSIPTGEFGTPASPRPLFRYRKHAQNEFYVIIFGGASATSAPQDDTRQEKGDETRDE